MFRCVVLLRVRPQGDLPHEHPTIDDTRLVTRGQAEQALIVMDHAIHDLTMHKDRQISIEHGHFLAAQTGAEQAQARVEVLEARIEDMEGVLRYRERRIAAMRARIHVLEGLLARRHG